MHDRVISVLLLSSGFFWLLLILTSVSSVHVYLRYILSNPASVCGLSLDKSKGTPRSANSLRLFITRELPFTLLDTFLIQVVTGRT